MDSNHHRAEQFSGGNPSVKRRNFMPFRPTQRFLGSLLVYYNEGMLVCADARLNALARVKGMSHG